MCPRSTFECVRQSWTGGLRQKAGGCGAVPGRLRWHSQSPAWCGAGCQVSAEVGLINKFSAVVFVLPHNSLDVVATYG